MSDKILDAIHIHGGYGKLEILHDVNLYVDRNEIVTILGPNGSGKSTFIKVVYNLATQHSGQVIYSPGGETPSLDISSHPSSDLVRMGIAYVPQIKNVFPGLTIEENIEMGGYILNEENMEKRKEEVFVTYPILEERKYHIASTLSGGQRQMLALARALMVDPKLIILDEPSAALQPNLVKEIMQRIKDLRDSQNVSVLIVEQNAKAALSISDRGYILAAGRLVYHASADVLLNETDMAAYYLGKHNN